MWWLNLYRQKHTILKKHSTVPFCCDVGWSHTPNIGCASFIRYGEQGYIKYQKEKYGVLKNKKRLIHTPVILYLFELKVIKNKHLDTEAYNIIKYKPGIYDISITMQKYMINCYFSEKEKEEFVNNLISDSHWLRIFKSYPPCSYRTCIRRCSCYHRKIRKNYHYCNY